MNVDTSVFFFRNLSRANTFLIQVKLKLEQKDKEKTRAQGNFPGHKTINTGKQ